jgi:hypothetical protein
MQILIQKVLTNALEFGCQATNLCIRMAAFGLQTGVSEIKPASERPQIRAECGIRE